MEHLFEFYRSTTYHDSDAEAKFNGVVAAEIVKKGSFRYRYEKNGFLIIGPHG